MLDGDCGAIPCTRCIHRITQLDPIGLNTIGAGVLCRCLPGRFDLVGSHHVGPIARTNKASVKERSLAQILDLVHATPTACRPRFRLLPPFQNSFLCFPFPFMSSGIRTNMQTGTASCASVPADFELQGSHRSASSEFPQSLNGVSFVSCLVVFVQGSLKFVPGLWAPYKLCCQGSAAVLIWLPGRGIR